MKDMWILFGAGGNGISISKQFKDRVAFFCDNDENKVGTVLEGKKVISFSKMTELHQKGYKILVTPNYVSSMTRQLKNAGIHDFVVYSGKNEMGNVIEDEKRMLMLQEPQTQFTDSFIEKVKDLDLLQDISIFKENAKTFLTNYRERFGNSYIPFRYGESGASGTLQAIMSYAGLDLSEVAYFPTISHLASHWWHFSTGDVRKGVIVSGERYKKFIHKYYAYVPVFTAGSYIQYATHYYDTEMMEQMKKKHGRILTIFMPHSTEGYETLYQEKEYLSRVLTKHGKDFDSIWACLYWTDIFSPVCDYLQSEGVHVVSAGYRGDTNFIRRLKTIFHLSDGVVIGECGAPFGYAFVSNKPVAYFDTNATHTKERVAKGYQQWLTGDDLIVTEGYRNLFNEELQMTAEQRVFINEVAGCDVFRSKEYFRNVLEISKDIWKMCGYEQSRYPIGVYSAYEFYRKTGDIEKALILREAVGDNFI